GTYAVLTTAGGTEREDGMVVRFGDGWYGRIVSNTTNTTPIVIFGAPYGTTRPRRFQRLFAWAASILLRPRSSPRVPMSMSVLSPDAYPMDAKSDFCWRCDSVPAADDLGLCVPCRLDLE